MQQYRCCLNELKRAKGSVVQGSLLSLDRHSEIVFQKLLVLYMGEKGNLRKLEEVNRSKKGSYASAIDTKVISPWALAVEVSLSKVLALKIALKVHLWCLNEWLT